MSTPLPARAAPSSSIARDAWLAVAIGVTCYWVSCLLVAPGVEPHGFGIDWTAMSKDPAAFEGRLPHRLLASTLAWLCGFSGPHYLLFARGLSIVLLATVCFFARRRGATAVDAMLVTIAVAVTASIQMYKQHWVGYPDALCYALFFWMLLASKHGALFWTLFFVNLLNHELVLFLLPWLWFVRREANGSVRTDLLGAGIAIAVYGVFYLWVRAAAQALFTYDYFVGHPLFPGGSFVTWCLALTHLVVAFGPVLAVLAWHQATRAHGRERWHLWLVLGGIVVIFCIAFDWARHSNLIVLPLVIASVRFLRAGHRAAYAALVALGVLLMLWVPPWSPSAWPTSEIVNEKLLAESGMLVEIPNGGPVPFGFGPLSAALTGWLPRVWPTFAAIVAIFAAIWLAGWWFARWSERRLLPRDGSARSSR